jgi:hypothetical protein
MNPTSWFAAIAGVLTLLAAAHAQPRVAVERLWTGIYTRQVQVIDDPTQPFGKRSVNRDVRLELETTRVPARIGTAFGIGFVFRGDAGQTVPYRVVWRYPRDGLTDPRSGKTVHESMREGTASVDRPRSEGHAFVYDWGLVPGEYIVKIWVGDKKLIEQAFDVFLP